MRDIAEGCRVAITEMQDVATKLNLAMNETEWVKYSGVSINTFKDEIADSVEIAEGLSKEGIDKCRRENEFDKAVKATERQIDARREQDQVRVRNQEGNQDQGGDKDREQ